MKRKHSRERRSGFPRIHSSFLLLGMLTLWFVWFGFSPFVTGVTNAGEPTSSFTEEAKRAIQSLKAHLMDSISKRKINDIQEGMDKIVSDSEKEGKPVHFGIGILDKNAVAVAGRYIRGIFREEDFSKYNFVKKAFKRKKIVQDRLFFQDRSELLVICVPLVQQRHVVGAIILGFDPAEVKKDYDLNTEQFLTLDFNK